MASPSSSVLSVDEQAHLRQKIIDESIANEQYLRKHPEVASVLGEVIREVLLRRPDEPVAFAEDFLATQDLPALAEEIKKRKV